MERELSSTDDIAELERLVQLVKMERPAVKAFLEAEIAKAKARARDDDDVASAAAPEPSSWKEPSVSSPTAAAEKKKPETKQRFAPIESYSWDDEGYAGEHVCVYITLEGVGAVKDKVTCTFEDFGFDLQVPNLNGVNHRMVKDNLERRINPSESKCVVKKNRVELRLAKKKLKHGGGYDHWSKLESNKTKAEKMAAESKKESDPSAGIFDIMNDMFEEGDDNTRALIGEAMMKAKLGIKPDAPKGTGLSGDFV